MKGLMLHCGAREVQLDEVRQITTPEPTDTWQPIPHGELVDLVQTALTEAGMRIVEQSHGLWRDNARYFGTFQLGNGNGDDADRGYSTVVGLRNSHDKAFPAGFAVGAGVFVCDNLSFSAEIVVMRKHTRFIRRDLPNRVFQAVAQLGDYRHKQHVRIDAYRERELIDSQVHDFLLRSVDARVIPNADVPKVLHEWREPEHEEFKPRTAWSLFNAYTAVMKGANRLELPKRTMALHGMLDAECKVLVGNGNAAVEGAV